MFRVVLDGFSGLERLWWRHSLIRVAQEISSVAGAGVFRSIIAVIVSRSSSPEGRSDTESSACLLENARTLCSFSPNHSSFAMISKLGSRNHASHRQVVRQNVEELAPDSAALAADQKLAGTFLDASPGNIGLREVTPRRQFQIAFLSREFGAIGARVFAREHATHSCPSDVANLKDARNW